MRYNIIQIIIMLLSLSACIDKFDPDITEYQDFLVVEGLITNDSTTYYVKLSRSGGIGGGGWIQPENNAIITIHDDLGNTYLLTEYKHGLYRSNPNNLIGEIGREYYVHIETEDGEVYESDPLKMLAVPPIDNIRKEYLKKESINPDKPDEGFLIYLDSYNQNNSCTHYKYKYEEIWEIFIHWTYPPVEKRHCWFSEESNNILIKSTEDLIDNSVIGFPVTFVSATTTNKLGIKYCINIKQYSLNKEEYEFWSKLSITNENIGGIYDPIPSSVQGNIFCCSDSSKRALGYFSVSAYTSARYFISKTEHAMKVYDPYDLCDEAKPPPPGLHYYILQSQPFEYTVDTACVDCTVDGTNKEPDYWNDTN